MTQETKTPIGGSYRAKWRRFFYVNLPVSVTVSGFVVFGVDTVLGGWFSWPGLAMFWLLIVIFPLAWALPPAPSADFLP